MGWRTTFTGTIHVHYGFVTVRFGDGEPPDPALAFGGQDNGLCGAADPRGLFLRTGLHTGRVALVVEVHEDMPAFASDVEEIVEASFRAPSDDAVFAAFDDGPYPLGLPEGEWRVRYSATGMDAAGDAAPTLGEPPIDRYLLQLWPGRRRIDRVVRQTSARAESWHEYARQLPVPPPPPTPQQVAAAEQREQERRRAARERFEVRRYWGGRPPSDRLRGIGAVAWPVAGRDRDLLDQLERAGAAVQRRLAVWAARRACDVADLSSTDWVAAGLDALDRGEPVPPPFDDLPRAFDRLRGGARTEMRIVVLGRGDPVPRIDPRYAALPAIVGARHADPLRAALEALNAAVAAFGDDDHVLLDEVRFTFPSIR